jgi:hypothetical protein
MKVTVAAGEVYGEWTTLAPAEGTNSRVLCRCSCGTERAVRIGKLRYGETLGCGCRRIETNTKRLTKHGHCPSTKPEPTYQSWTAMLRRCLTPTSSNFELYGGRGISVCERWKKFENFLADMGKRPDGTSLDRVDVNGNYEPSNCRWATYKEKSRNRRNGRVEPHEYLQIAWLAQRYGEAEIAEFFGLAKKELGSIVKTTSRHKELDTRP